MSDSMNELTPSAKIIRRSNEVKTIKDSTGRTLTYRALKPSDQVELISLIGAERTMNQIVFAMCSATYKVQSIDGLPVFPPDTYEELKKNMDELSESGLQAMYDSLTEPVKEEPAKTEKVKA